MPVANPDSLTGTKARTFVTIIAVPILIVAVVFALYLVKSDNLQTSDPVWAPHLTASLIYDGDPFLNEYEQWIERADYYAIVKAGERLDSLFPWGGPLLAVIPSVILDAVLPELRDTTLQEFLLATAPSDPAVQRFQLINAALIVALSAGVIYLIGREYLPPSYAVFLVAVYAFGTSAYSTASRAMWQHGPSMLMVSITLLLFIKARQRPDLIRFAALPLAAAYLMRPTNVVSVAVLSLYVLVCYRKYFVHFVLGGLLLGIPFILLSEVLYGSWMPPYYSAGRLEFSATFVEALWGNLVSPARGLFVFSPIFLLIPAGIGLRMMRKKWTLLDWAVLAILVLHWLVISSFPHWWAGHSFGPRFFSDVLPYAVYFLIPILEEIQSSKISPRIRGALVVAFGFLAAISVAIHYRGVASAATQAWNNLPLNVDEHPGRLWDWSDPQFLRGIGGDLITISPENIVVTANSTPDEEALYLDLGLMADGPIDITIRLPRRVSLVEHTAWLFDLNPLPGGGQTGRLSEPLTGIGLLRLFVQVDSTNIAEETSLGAIEIVARKHGRAGVIQEEIRVINLSTGMEPTGTGARPHDIAIHCSPTTNDELFALFGAGWYDEETFGDASWRWASWPAFLHIWSDVAQTAAVELNPSSVYDPSADDGMGQEGTLRVTDRAGDTKVILQAGQPAGFETRLQPGWNTIALELETGSFRPADLTPGHFDARDLSFSIDLMSVTGKCAPPAAQP